MATPVGDDLIRPKRFRRGIDLGPPHPVIAQPIEEMPAPKLLHVPLKQHYGLRCEPRVHVGDQVRMGQLLGESADPMAAPVHAPVSGKVLAVADRLDPFGRKVLTVTLENDGRDEWVEPPREAADFMGRKISAMMRAIRMAGVVRGDGVPVHTRLSPPERPKAYIFLVGIPVVKPIRLLIVNALDAEPTQAVNRRLLVERPEDIRQGVDLFKKLAGVKHAALAIGGDLTASSAPVRAVVREGLTPVSVDLRYPVSQPHLLTTAITGREIPWPDGVPRDVGAMVMDLEAILAGLEAVRDGKPQVDRVVSVTGPEMTSRNLRVRLGTPLGDVVAFAGGAMDQAAKVVVGGLMSGWAQYDPAVGITKETRSVTVLGPQNLVRFTEQLCVKCGRCVGVCPMRLLPNVMTNFIEFSYFDEAVDAELFKCIECGCCAYVCPAKRPLVHYVKHGKAEVLAKRAGR
jgi:electron transport complex protein RnfC